MALEVGVKAPDFTLYDASKTKRSLHEFAGKTVVLAFYPGAFTGVCDKEVCSLRDSMTRYNELNAEVLGISIDGFPALKEFTAKYNLNFTLLSDFNREVTNAYDVLFTGLGGVEGYTVANRAVYIVDKDGVIRYAWTAQPNPGVEPNYDEVIAAVESLG